MAGAFFQEEAGAAGKAPAQILSRAFPAARVGRPASLASPFSQSSSEGAGFAAAVLVAGQVWLAFVAFHSVTSQTFGAVLLPVREGALQTGPAALLSTLAITLDEALLADRASAGGVAFETVPSAAEALATGEVVARTTALADTDISRRAATAGRQALHAAAIRLNTEASLALSANAGGVALHTVVGTASTMPIVEDKSLGASSAELWGRTGEAVGGEAAEAGMLGEEEASRTRQTILLRRSLTSQARTITLNTLPFLLEEIAQAPGALSY